MHPCLPGGPGTNVIRTFTFAMTASAALHAAPLAWLVWTGAPSLLGGTTAGGSGWVQRRAPVTWEGAVVLAEDPVGRETAEAPPPMPVALQEAPAEDADADRTVEAPAFPEMMRFQGLPEAVPDGGIPCRPLLSSSLLRDVPGEWPRRRSDAPTQGQAQIQDTPSTGALPPEGSGKPASPLRGEGRSIGSVGTVPAALWNPQPLYPEAARSSGWDGAVEVELSIATDGHVEGTRVVTSSGRDLLDEAALAALRRWRFQPRGGDGAPLRVVQKVVFRLGNP